MKQIQMRVAKIVDPTVPKTYEQLKQILSKHFKLVYEGVWLSELDAEPYDGKGWIMSIGISSWDNKISMYPNKRYDYKNGEFPEMFDVSVPTTLAQEIEAKKKENK